MPENEFEKKVSSEMQDLKFKPSEKVWLQVEERIRKKKKKRVFIIIFLLAGIALLGYWQRNNLFGDPNSDLVNTEKPADDVSIPAEASTRPSSDIPSPDNKTENEKQDNVDEKVTIQGEDNTLKKDYTNRVGKEQIVNPVNRVDRPKNKNATQKKITSKADQVENKNEDRPVSPGVVVAPRDQKQEPIELKPQDSNVVIPPVEVQTREEPKPETIPVENKVDAQKTDTISGQTRLNETNDTLSRKQQSPDSNTIVQKNSFSKKWKWGIQFTPGVSFLNDQSFSLGMEKNAAADFFSSPGTGAGNPPPPPPPAPPSDHKAGFAFHLGAFVQKQFTPRSGLLIGLQYGYYSEHINVGSRRDTGAGRLSYSLADASSIYNAANATENHTNSYHFMEGSIYYQLRLNKNNIKPLTWDLGVNIGQLLATNAVMYDTTNRGIYYKNTDLLNKTQFSLSTGFSWTFSNNRQTQWNIGPVIDFHLNSLLDNPFENKKYLFFAGLRSAVIFNSKK